MMKIQMGKYYTLGHLGLVRTIARAKNCETTQQMIMFCQIGNGGFAGENLLWNESDFIKEAKKESEYVHPQDSENIADFLAGRKHGILNSEQD